MSGLFPEKVQFPPLRDFQTRSHLSLRAGFMEGHKRQLIMAPTGAGKTILALHLIHQSILKGRKALFLCDRKTLIHQTSDAADALGMTEHGVIQADHWRRNNAPFQIGSVQTLAKRQWPKFDLIVADECHVVYRALLTHLESFDGALLGLSATPFTKGLGNIYSNFINAATMDELTRQGILVPMRVYQAKRIDMTGAETANGEWTDEAVEQRGMEIIGDVVTEWIQYGENRPTIVFGATVKHCEEMRQQFVSCGITAELYTGDTPDEERERLLGLFDGGELRVLLSVAAISKGFDRRYVGCICDVRPLRKSLSEVIQMWGRGLRCSPETGKTDLILLEFSGNAARFAEDYSEVYFNGLKSLDDAEQMDAKVRKEPEKKEGMACPKCGYKPCGPRCVACGHEIKKAASLIEHEAGAMMEIDLTSKGIKALGERPDVYQQIASYVRQHGSPATAEGRAAHLYRDIYGCWPASGWKPHKFQMVPISDAVMNRIRYKNIKYAKAKSA